MYSVRARPLISSVAGVAGREGPLVDGPSSIVNDNKNSESLKQ